ncbi:uncharacterized protein AC631_02840 [Debaryomyces fabryi]|uniref:Mannosyltransferase n=1 Tax=Debaryomyces fabryi TaxID=58627 RepID=A0A0V1PYS4_9ASCO|nr:uncharacterized protein AC631_02840 [Debaryomyces fabryi]KSA01412.1 hypothetical protein AC631_02840 [Debaryomyces fabryi]CUM52851.1 unnamed protein product [Debaryomyces fabryi]
MSIKANVGDSQRLNGLQIGIIALNVLLRVYSAFFMIISDCDETFNYWEPLNLLIRGFGKQTWEYSPEYAIRSYAYLIPYAIVTYPVKLVGTFANIPSYYQFYWIRLIALCGFTCFTELRLFYSINSSLNRKVGNWFLFLSSIAPGMSHAGVALLPSSFAMNCVTMATANSLLAISENNISYSVHAIVWFLIGGIVGWPFALALGLPFGLFILIQNINKYNTLFSLIKGCVFGLVSILIISTSIDSWFYQKFDLVPLNIVLYNVFGEQGEGPEIFGVEPFHYYILNLLVNFNIVAILGYIGLVLNVFLFGEKNRYKVLITVSSPLLIWSIIFGGQPHKEERFLYPIYPLLILSSSLLLTFIFPMVTFMSKGVTANKINSKHIEKLVQLLFAFLVGVVSILRIINLVENYSTPLSVHREISALPVSDMPVNVCTGREWYHFPNSFFLPDNYRLKFIRSGFDGLLPGDFLEGTSLKTSTSSIPPNMNNKNQYANDKVINFEECSYYVDNSQAANLEVGEPSIIERNGDELNANEDWSVVQCRNIINPSGTSSGIGKVLWIPEYLRSIVPYNVDYMDYCLMEKKKNIV